MRRSIYFCLLFLCACDTPGPGFYGQDARYQQVENSRFTLRINGPVAEVIRTSPEPFPRYEQVAARATVALQHETGCQVAWIEGDPSMMLAGLACDGAPPPPKPRKRRHVACAFLTENPIARCPVPLRKRSTVSHVGTTP